uniref:N-acetyltransferase domain-containing protein n=1 Tax=Arthrobacter sp. J3.40 TaxID=347209 RepID=I3W107_9MICC|nr:hypothetical protein [Arthrobacter sp. J3.40]
MPFYYGSVKPFPRHRKLYYEGPDSADVALEATTFLKFRLLDRVRGDFNIIEVEPSRQRRGWGSDMVRALLRAYPDATWSNQSLNRQSGPMFQRLSSEFPERIAPVSRGENGRFTIGLRPIR